MALTDFQGYRWPFGFDLGAGVRVPAYMLTDAAGNVVLVDEAGTSMTYTLTQGQVLPFRPVIVKATGTTATVIGWE